ncbi:MAG: S1 RNA-binding domain-containing protein [Lachnospiraceae bacterium]|nr:S1 RNA-binding domain-containing protein [Lachnospiraceae bacterium]
METKETMEDYKEELEASFRKINVGDIISGTVIDVNEEEVTLDLKYYAPGVIKAADLSSDPNYKIMEEVKPGDVIKATVVRTDDGAGNIQLSGKEANEVLAWDKLKEYQEQETELSVKITGIVPSGVVAYLEGIRGFIPASQLALSYVEVDDSWLGKELEVRVITVEESKKKLVMSAKVILKEKAAQEHDRKISMLVPGTVLEGVVESLMPYGAFVDIGDGISGLVHISQISTKRIGKPSEVLSVGQKVKVKILNTNDHKVSLSMRALEEEMVDTDRPGEVKEYISKEKASTSLGDLLAGIKLN